jgi:hypothetical protein
MNVTLAGPDGLGYWFLDDDKGRSFPLVNNWNDHIAAASMFGWTASEEAKDEDEIIEEARLWLMDHIGDAIKAPKDIEDYFREFDEE